jgi:hypothetical protein
MRELFEAVIKSLINTVSHHYKEAKKLDDSITENLALYGPGYMNTLHFELCKLQLEIRTSICLVIILVLKPWL